MKLDFFPFADQRDLVLIRLENEAGVIAHFTNYGASLFSLETKDDRGAYALITPQLKSQKEFLNSPQFFGKTLGRTSGRICNSILQVNGQSFALESSYGKHTLHGGKQSFSFKVFEYSVESLDDQTNVIFRVVSPFGEGGYPGRVEVEVRYALMEKTPMLRIDYFATTDFPTALNLSNHTYFNLNGDFSQPIGNHTLQLNAPFVYKIDPEMCVMDKVPVWPLMDFTKGKVLGSAIEDPYLQNAPSRGYDHVFESAKTIVATLSSPSSKRTVKIESSYPACNLYTANYSSQSDLLDGHIDRKYSGVAIECHFVPSQTKTYLFSPERPYHHWIEYTFGLQKK